MIQPDPALVSVVILSFNSAHLLPRAVQSVLEQEYAPIELIIVDNASTDGTAELLDRYADIATVVRHNENLGFAQGMNAGYTCAHGAYFVPLNTDAVLHPHFVRNAVALFEQHADLGVVAPEVLKLAADGEWRFWSSAYDGAPAALTSEGGVVALTPLLRVHVLDNNRDDWRPSFKANGACPIIRRALLDDMERTFGVAPFDPVFDTYGEDVDFAFKAWALRWRTMYARSVLAGHVRSYASALELPDKRGWLRINLIAERPINAVRHLRLPHLIGVLLLALVQDAAMVLRQWYRGDRAALRDVRAGWGRVIRLWPDLLRFRVLHRTWRSIDWATEVYCQQGPTAEMQIQEKIG